MTLSINEINIRLRVSEERGGETVQAAKPGDEEREPDQAAMIEQCVRRVLAALKSAGER